MEKDTWVGGDLKGAGVKHDLGKPDYSLLPPHALECLVRVYDYGVQKYARDNWRHGIKFSRVFAAVMRHLWAWWRCEEDDQESNCKHLAAAAWGCFTLLEYTKTSKYADFDDRLVEDFLPVTPETPEEAREPDQAVCKHEWVWAGQYTDSAGTHIHKRCSKCSTLTIEDLAVERPYGSVSIPSIWTSPMSEIKYTLTTTPTLVEGERYILENGELKALSNKEKVD